MEKSGDFAKVFEDYMLDKLQDKLISIARASLPDAIAGVDGELLTIGIYRQTDINGKPHTPSTPWTRACPPSSPSSARRSLISAASTSAA
eukprot:4311606-Prymnesium_polylepis.1